MFLVYYICLRLFLEISLSCMFLTNCFRQNDRIDRGIISRFRRTNWFSWRNVTKKRIRVGFPLFQLLYNWFISSCMRNTDKFILDIFFSSPPRHPLAPFGSLWLPLGVPGAALGRLLDLIKNWTSKCAVCIVNTQQHLRFLHSPADPAFPAEVVSWSGVSTPTSTAPGVRMTWVSQTPSN